MDFEAPAYIVASGLWKFLWFFLRDTDKHWPFDKEDIARHDPMMLECVTAPLPWDDQADDAEDGDEDHE